MTQSIRSRAQRATNKIAQYRNSLKEIQKECLHMAAVKIPKADTGNYDKTQDAYWFSCDCPDCFKKWIEPQR